jgi:hypothetical protein
MKQHITKAEHQWKNWLIAKRDEAARMGDSTVEKRWARALSQFLATVGIETYVSPFTGKET